MEWRKRIEFGHVRKRFIEKASFLQVTDGKLFFQVAAAEANVPEAPPVDAAPSLKAQAPIILLALLWLQARTAFSPNLL